METPKFSVGQRVRLTCGCTNHDSLGEIVFVDPERDEDGETWYGVATDDGEFTAESYLAVAERNVEVIADSES